VVEQRKDVIADAMLRKMMALCVHRMKDVHGWSRDRLNDHCATTELRVVNAEPATDAPAAERADILEDFFGMVAVSALCCAPTRDTWLVQRRSQATTQKAQHQINR